MLAERFRGCLVVQVVGRGDIPMLTQAVAVYFRELREGRGFTQESLATAVDVSKRTVERLERSEGDISVEPFERIIAVLGASPEEVNYLATNPSAPTAARVRAVTYLGATVDDLDRITSASTEHEHLGRQLAEARISGATQLRKHAGRDNTPVPADNVVLRASSPLRGSCMRY